MEAEKDIQKENGKNCERWIGEIIIDEQIFIDMPEACRVCGMCKGDIKNKLQRGCYIPCG